jgi:hypothetical protein
MTNTTPSPPIDLWNELSLANSALLRASRHIAVAISDRHPVFQATVVDRLQKSGEALANNLLDPTMLGTDSYLVARLVAALLGATEALLKATKIIADEEGFNGHARDALRAVRRANHAVRCHLQARGLLQEGAGGDG